MLNLPLALAKRITAVGLRYDIKLVANYNPRNRMTLQVRRAVLTQNGVPISGLFHTINEVDAFVCGLEFALQSL
jgi:hypothetical protein